MTIFLIVHLSFVIRSFVIVFMPRPSWYRVVIVSLAGNVLGVAAWQSALVLIPRLWGGTNASTGLLARVGLIAVSAMLIAAPPVLIGALGAWLARRAQMWVGLACGLWGFSLIQAVPATFPIASGVWYAPTVLILLSSTLGGWLLDLREQARYKPVGRAS